MASYLDNFADSPYTSARWQNVFEGGTFDGANLEFDLSIGSGDNGIRYQSDLAIEHEAQVTARHDGGRTTGPGVRFHNTGTGASGYAYGIYLTNASDLTLARYDAGARTILYEPATGLSLATGDFVTIRLAAEGTDGANVVLSIWILDHNSATKPSDPGWIGVDGSPDFSYTDTAAGRLDDAALHIRAGIAGRDGLAGDSGHDFWKARDISERGGGGSILWVPVTQSAGVSQWGVAASGLTPTGGGA